MNMGMKSALLCCDFVARIARFLFLWRVSICRSLLFAALRCSFLFVK